MVTLFHITAGNPEEEEEDSAPDYESKEMEENKEEIDPAQNHTQGEKRKQVEVKNLVQSS